MQSNVHDAITGRQTLNGVDGCRKVSDAKVLRNLQSLLPKNGKRQRHTLAAPRTHSQKPLLWGASNAPGRRARRIWGCQDSIGRHGRGPRGRPHALDLLRSQCLAKVRQDRLSRGSGGISSTGECHCGMRISVSTSGAVRWVGRGT